jgi:hypothetical protein
MIKNHATTPQIGHAYDTDKGKIRMVLQKLCMIDPEARWDCMQALEYMDPKSPIIIEHMKKWSSIYKQKMV